METKKKGNNWTAYFNPEKNIYFAEILYISREGMECYDYEITQEIYDKLGTFDEDYKSVELIETGERTYSFENTMYGTQGPRRTVWNDEANDAMNETVKKNKSDK